MRKSGKLSMEQKRNLKGMMFIIPFLLGLLLVFIPSLAQSFWYSLQKFIVSEGVSEPYFTGLQNYYSALRVDPDFVRIALAALGDMLLNLPIIIIFSFFAANLLNQNFTGRLAARAIFFFPVVASVGIVASLGAGDLLMGMLNTGDSQSSMAGGVRQMLYSTGISPVILDYITGAVDRIYSIISMSGVQILIALSGLQTISKSLYESSDIDGATGWDKFWKITFPMMGPILLVNGVYSIIDLLTRSNNQLMNLVRNLTFQAGQTGLANAMNWIYFLVIAIALLVIILPFSRRVFYNE